MPSIDVRNFRNARQIRSWLQAGQTIDLIEEDRVVARILPPEKIEVSRPGREKREASKELIRRPRS